MQIEIRANKAQTDKLIRELAHIQHGAPKAMAAALNKTATGVKTDIKKEVSKIYTIKQSEAGASMRTGKKATPGDLTASVVGDYKPISLKHFRTTSRKIRDSRGKPNRQVSAEVKRGAKKVVQGAFVVSGNFIAKRSGANRFPIEKLHGPAVSQMMKNDGIQDRVETKAQGRMDIEVDRALKMVESRR